MTGSWSAGCATTTRAGCRAPAGPTRIARGAGDPPRIRDIALGQPHQRGGARRADRRALAGPHDLRRRVPAPAWTRCPHAARAGAVRWPAPPAPAESLYAVTRTSLLDLSNPDRGNIAHDAADTSHSATSAEPPPPQAGGRACPGRRRLLVHRWVLDASGGRRSLDLLLGGALRRLCPPRPAALRRAAAAALPGDGPAGVADPAPAPGLAHALGGGGLRRHRARPGRRRTRSTGCSPCARRSAPCSPTPCAAAAAPSVGGRRAGRAGAGAVAAGQRPRPAATTRRTALTAPGRAALLRRGGVRRRCVARCCAPAPACSTRPGSTPAARAANLAGSMCCPAPGLRRLARRRPRARSWCATTSSRPAPPPARRSARWRPSGCGGRGGGRRGDPAAAPAGRVTAGPGDSSGPGLSSWRPDRLASVHGVRPGPWLRRRGAPVRGAHRGKPMPVAGETVHVRLAGSVRRGSRSRCGLEVSPASSSPSDTASDGRRAVVAEKLRTPQQAIVGSKTRSAGRTPSSQPSHGPSRTRSAALRGASGDRGNQLCIGRFTWKLWSPVDTASCRIGSASHVEEKLARLEKHDHRIMRVQVEVECERNPRQHDRRRAAGAHGVLQGPGDPRRGGRRGQDGRARPRPGQDGRADAPGGRPPPHPPRPPRPGLGRRGPRRRARRPCPRRPRTTS